MIISPNDFKLGHNLYKSGKKNIIYVRFCCKGKDVRRSTGKRDLPLARQVAWAIYCEVAGIPNQTKVSLRRSTYAKVSEIIDIYKTEISKCGRCSPSSAHGNSTALYRILKDLNLDNPRIDRLESQLITQWRTIKYQQRGLKFGIDEDLKLNLSLNSMYRQAKSVFSSTALSVYDSIGIKIPVNIEKFKSVPALKQMDTRFTAIPSDVDDAIKLASDVALNIKTQKDIDDWVGENPERKAFDICNNIPSIQTAIAVQLARYCGLTLKEIAGLRWEWFENINGVDAIAVRYRAATDSVPAWGSKGDKKNGNIAVNPQLITQWKKALSVEDKKVGYVLDAPTSFNRRKFNIERQASQFLNQFIPDRRKKLHELRKQAGSEMATKFGIYVAATFLRDSVVVAEKHYANFIGLPPALF